VTAPASDFHRRHAVVCRMAVGKSTGDVQVLFYPMDECVAGERDSQQKIVASRSRSFPMKSSGARSIAMDVVAHIAAASAPYAATEWVDARCEHIRRLRNNSGRMPVQHAVFCDEEHGILRIDSVPSMGRQDEEPCLK
jgi:hypothetical protein